MNTAGIKFHINHKKVKEVVGRGMVELHRKIHEIKGRTQEGFIAAGRVVREDAVKYTPEDLGNLKSSSYVAWKEASESDPNFKIGPGRYGKRADVGRLHREHVGAISRRRGMLPNDEPGVAVGFSAYYSLWVHESMGQKHPGGGDDHFLIRAVHGNRQRIVDEIVSHARKATR